jgi:xanthine dehydrogenase accessory factor
MYDLTKLKALSGAHGPVARVVVVDIKGSAPRETGASMIVWGDGQDGTIGGGTLEYQAAQAARAALSGDSQPNVTRLPLGPALNQCCGGAVTLVREVIHTRDLATVSGPGHARSVTGDAGAMPGLIRRALDRAANLGQPVPLLFQAGWLLEPTTHPALPVVIYGAGHVGQALAGVLDPLPDFAVTLADDRAPGSMEFGGGVAGRPRPVRDALAAAPDHAQHLIMTHAHDLDLDLCHRLLGRTTGGIGLIGSATKWARFSKRLQSLGHTPEAIARIRCPIGDPAFGKHPQAIALGVATDLLRMAKAPAARREAC